MPSKIIKPGTVVFDTIREQYVVFKAYSADRPGHAFVYTPTNIQNPYLTTVRLLNRKERGEG